MTLTDRLGFAKFFYNVGKEYADLFRGSVTGGAAITFVANYFGLSKLAAIGVGATLVPVSLAIAIGAGYLVVRWRVIHKTIEKEWENNPYMRTQIDLLREIRDRVSTPVIVGRFSNGFEERAHQRAVNIMELR